MMTTGFVPTTGSVTAGESTPPRPAAVGRVLVLGATGGIGGEVARQLRDAGWEVRALRRGAPPVDPVDLGGLDWHRGDAMVAGDVLRAAEGCSVIVHAVNPPGYRRWSEQVLPMIDSTIAAAAANGATVVLPGTVYNFGPDAMPRPTESSPQRPLTRKGAIRVELERRLAAAAAAGDLRAIVVRAGDFFGPRAGNNWFAQGIVRPQRPVREIRLPGAPGVGHQWAYLPDVARTMRALIDRRERLAPFAVLQMEGHWDPDGGAFAAAIERVVVRTTGVAPRRRAFPWWQVRLAAPFVETLRELLEMRYLWQQPLRMDNAPLVAELGAEPRTPLDEAIEATLVGLGCLPRRTAASPATPPFVGAIPADGRSSG